MLFVLVLLSNVLVTGSFYPLIYIAVAVLHEIGHLLAIWICSHRMGQIKFVGFGIRIKNKDVYSYRNEIVISASGPMVNIVFGLCGLFLYSIYSRVWIAHVIFASIAYAILNLLPISPLDGYKIISATLYRSMSYHTAKMLLRFIGGLSLGLIVLSLIFVMANDFINYSLVPIFCVVAIGAINQIING